jgi:hypothetical protein
LVREWKIVRDRQACANWIGEYGGRVVPTDSSDEARPSVHVSIIRRLMGDRAIVRVELPFGMPPQARSEAERAFPEARSFSSASGGPLVDKLFGGHGALEILQHPDRVEAYRLKSEESIRPEKATLADYPTSGDPIEVPQSVASGVSSALSSPESYHWWIYKDCPWAFDVRMSFFRGNDRVDLLFNLDSDMLLILQDNRFAGRGYFDYGHNLITATMKEFFPEDELLQLKARRPGSE